MALTPERIDAAYREVWSTVPHKYRLSAFAEEIAAEVRKDDEALIQRMLEALEKADKISGYPNNHKAIAAARARLKS